MTALQSVTTPTATAQVVRMNGYVTSVGFETGDRFVVGYWLDGPIGPMSDVMWARPDGTRVLLADSQRSADYICAVYSYEEVSVVPINVERVGRRLFVEAGPLRLRVTLRRGLVFPIFVPGRPLWFTRWVERPICALVFPGVRTYGVQASGIEQWYPALWVRPVREAFGFLDGRELGRSGGIRPRVSFGFSEPPHVAAQVRVRPALRDRTGRLNRLLDRLAQE